MKKELIKAFTNEQFGNVRAVLIGEKQEPYFVGKDVAECLGYANTRDALKTHVDDEDKAGVVIHDGSQNRNVIGINESGLYSLILSSKLPSAKEFKRWVTSEVLPSIRQTGSYSSANMTMEDIIIYQMEQTKAMKQQLDNQSIQIAETKEELKGIRDIVSLNPNSWRKDSTNLVNQIAMFKGGTQECYREIRYEIYALVNQRAGCNLEIRLTNMKRRLREEGICNSKLAKLNQLDVIAQDKKLIEIYLIIVKEMCIKYGLDLFTVEGGK